MVQFINNEWILNCYGYIATQACVVYDETQKILMGKTDSRSLLEQETVLLHTRNRIKIRKPNIPVGHKKAVKPSKISHAENGKQLLGLYLDFFNYIVLETRRTVVLDLPGR